MGMIGVLAYIFEMYVRPQDWMAFMYGFPLVDLVAGAALVIVLFSLLQDRRPLALPQVGFILFFLMAVFLSNFFNGTGEAFDYFLIYAKRAAVFFMMLCLIKSPKQLRAAMGAIVILTVFLAIQSIYQSKTGVGLAGQTILEFKNIDMGRARWVGAWDGPNVLCLLFVIAIAFSLEFIGKTNNVLIRFLNMIFVGVMMAGVYVTNSRGGFIGLLVVFFAYIWVKVIKNKKLLIKTIIAAMAIIIIMAGLKFGPSRVAHMDTKESSANERRWLWEQALNTVKEKPAFGVGKGQFMVEGYSEAHNNFVQNMVEMGIPGLFIYVSLIYLSLKGVYTIADHPLIKKKDAQLMSLSNALFLSMVGYTVTTFFVTMELDILFLWFGLCAAAVNIARGEMGDIPFRFSLKDAGVVSAGVIMVIFVVYLIAIAEII